MKIPPHPGLSVKHDCIDPVKLTVTAAAQVLIKVKRYVAKSRTAHDEARP